MCDKNLILVKTIKKYPCLYNHESAEYSRKSITEKAWNDVATETNQTVSECREKWKNLRYSFVRSLKPNPDGSLKKKYYLNDEMEFILPYVRVYTSKATGSETHFLDYDSDDDNNDNNQNALSPLQAAYLEANDTHHMSEPTKKKLKLSDTYNIQSTYVPDRHYEDSRRMFLLGLLPEVAELTEPEMRIFRRKVLELLDDVSHRRNEKTGSLCNIQQTFVHENDIMKSEPA